MSNNSLVPLKRELNVPAGISKSTAKAQQCTYYYIHEYLGASRRRIDIDAGPMARIGTEFHQYRADYVNHLVDVHKEQDRDWVYEYLGINDGKFYDETLFLISRDDTFSINPDTVYGTEVFLSCDRQLNVLDHEIGNATPGKMSKHPNVFASGTIDLLCIDGSNAVIIDPKSSFATSGVDDNEPIINALLVFAKFKMIEHVEFRWDFARIKVNRRTHYSRSKDLAWMIDRVVKLHEQKIAAIADYNAGRPLAANPFAGLCGWCSLVCPDRQAALSVELTQSDNGWQVTLPPPQTDADRVRLARWIMVCETLLPKMRDLLRPVLSETGPVRCAGDLVLQAESVEGSSYSLIPALNALDLAVIDISGLSPALRDQYLSEQPEKAKLYDVPLKPLTVSAGKLNSLAKTKRSAFRKNSETGESTGGVSRAGLAERLDQIANRYERTFLRFRHMSDSDLINDLRKSIEMVEQQQLESEKGE
jgi:hypothetical protein